MRTSNFLAIIGGTALAVALAMFLGLHDFGGNDASATRTFQTDTVVSSPAESALFDRTTGQTIRILDW